MSIIPCSNNPELRRQIESFVETLKTQAHTLGEHGLNEEDFYKSGLFRGAIESVRGEFSATMRGKREFVREVLNFMQDRGYISDWESSGASNRHDYRATLKSGKVAVLELKGCLDGNNTNIFDRPAHANEFIVWSLCTNSSADPKKNAWSGIHTRLSAEIISANTVVDGLVIWDMVCGTVDRPCPKLHNAKDRATRVSQFEPPPPCIYVFPATVPSPRNNPHAMAQKLENVEFLAALQDCFRGRAEEINYVSFDVGYQDVDTVRKTTVVRGGVEVKGSNLTSIRRR